MMGNNIKRLQAGVPHLAASLSSIESQIIALQDRTTQLAGQSIPLDRARDHFKKQKSRERIFGRTTIFSDPAWNILVDLFIASEERKPITVSSACISSSVPTTTALRYLKLLEDDGHILRVEHRSNGRLSLLYLSEATNNQLRRYFAD